MESHRAGRRLAPEDLCRDDPDLLDEVCRGIDELGELSAAARSLGAGTTVPSVDPAPHAASETAAPSPAPARSPTDSGLGNVTIDQPTRERGRATAPPSRPIDIAGYEIQGELGRGGMGVVYKARHVRLDRTVAIKLINRDRLLRDDAVLRFQREARTAARLAHPNIVSVYDASEVEGLHFLVMEYVEGVDLAHLVRQSGALPVAQACEFIRQAALGLQHAHERGMAHRDIKPQNLMLTPGGRVKILDFGLARFVTETPSSEEGLTPSGVIMGTPDYIAPEQARNARQADSRADIYSLGCALYHLLAGKVPFPDGTTTEKLVAHLERAPVALPTLRADLPAGLERVLARMMAKDPAKRYQTPHDVVLALAPYTQGRPATRRTWSRAWAAAWAGAAILLVATGGYLLQRPADKPASPAPAPPGVVPELAPAAQIKELRRFTHEDVVWCAAFAEDGTLGLSGSGDKRVGGVWVPGTDQGLRLWNATTGVQVRHFPMKGQRALSLSVSPDGNRAAVGSSNGTVWVWEIGTGKEVRRFTGHGEGVHGLAFLPDNRHVLSGSYDHNDNNLLLWDVETGTVAARLTGHAGPVHPVAVSQDGQIAVTGGGDATVRVWDLKTRTQRKHFAADSKYLTGVALSPDNRLALSSGDTVQLWDLATGQEVGRLSGHTGWVWRVAFSPDGRRALTASQDKTVRLWEVETGREIAAFTGHNDMVYWIAFSPDGSRALSASQDTTVRVLQLP
jgi:tRNA A-37 threonylcarbamoyl transferase component Bud32